MKGDRHYGLRSFVKRRRSSRNSPKPMRTVTHHRVRGLIAGTGGISGIDVPRKSPTIRSRIATHSANCPLVTPDRRSRRATSVRVSWSQSASTSDRDIESLLPDEWAARDLVASSTASRSNKSINTQDGGAARRIKGIGMHGVTRSQVQVVRGVGFGTLRPQRCMSGQQRFEIRFLVAWPLKRLAEGRRHMR